MRILMAAAVPGRREGGVAAIASNLGREMEKRGHQVRYVFLEDLMAPPFPVKRLGDLAFSMRLAKFIYRNKREFDVVHLHAPSGFAYGVLQQLRLSGEGPPYVMMLHGLEERRTHAMRREAGKGKTREFGLKNRLWHTVYHVPRFYFSIKTADRATCYVREVWTLLQLKYGMDSSRVTYIPNGVEERFFSTSRQYEGKAGIRLLWVGTWLEQRGIHYLREALNRLVASRPGISMTFAGCGVPAEVVHNFFGEGLHKQIEVRPFVPSDEMPAVYAQHDVFLFPSLMEGLPSVLLEAMASGMPVITTETCGMIDVIEHEVDGILIPPADAGAIEKQVLALAGSSDLRRRLGTAAREKVKRLTWRKSAQRLEAVFAEAIQANHPHS